MTEQIIGKPEQDVLIPKRLNLSPETIERRHIIMLGNKYGLGVKHTEEWKQKIASR